MQLLIKHLVAMCNFQNLSKSKSNILLTAFILLFSFEQTAAAFSSNDTKLDTAQVNFVNQHANLSKVYVWTHYQECYKCGYFPVPSVLKFNETFKKQFLSYYTLKYAVTAGNRSDLGVLCNGTVATQDQSIHNLTITLNLTSKCTLQLIKAGRNNAWPLAITVATILALLLLFYSARSWYQKENRNREIEVVNEADEALKVKLSQRLNSLDAFRGMTIMMMIFCNWGAGQYHFLEHIEWDGLRFADVIFPFFVFIMGATLGIGLRNQVIKKNLPLPQVVKHILIRAAKLFFLGMVVNSDDLRTIRITGVLQRFSLSYMIVALTYVYSLNKSREYLSKPAKKWYSDLAPYWPEWILVLAMMAIYFPVTYLWKFDPHCPVGYLGVGGFSENGIYANCTGGAANRLDKLLLSDNHILRDLLAGKPLYDPLIGEKKRMYEIHHDCEGVLGYTTSILLTVLGLQAGKIMLTYTGLKDRFGRLIIWSIISGIFTAALAAPGWVPINKNLWSFTFATANATMAFFIFSLMYLLIDHLKVWPLGHPLHYPGMNSIFLYIGHIFTYDTFPFFYIHDNSSHVWPLVQGTTGLLLWLLISVYAAKRRFFVTL